MLTLYGLRFEHYNDFVKIVCDISCDGENDVFGQRQFWFATPKGNEFMFSDKSYDPFLPVALYLAMNFHTDLHIKGKVSKKLYKNLVTYCKRIYSDFSDQLKNNVKVIVDGFITVEKTDSMIGTGISCGVDSFSTIMDRFVCETDEEYKVNSLFFFDYGSCGDFGLDSTKKLFYKRYERSLQVAKELGLPLYLIDSNVHAFSHGIGGIKIGALALFSCVLSVQAAVSKYYISSDLSYIDVLKYHKNSYNYSICEWSETYLTPLIQTEKIDIILDGAQYQRTEKLNRISDWSVAQKYLNVCVGPSEDASNCSACVKCLRTMQPLDYMGKLNNFKQVFNLEKYYKIKYRAECDCVVNYGKNPFLSDIVDLAKKYQVNLPELHEAERFLCNKKRNRSVFKKIRSVKRYIISKIKTFKKDN